MQEFLAAVQSAVSANPKAGNKWDELEQLFSENGLRGNGTLNYGGGADRTTRARQLGTSKAHKGHRERAVAKHSVFVIGGDTLESYDKHPEHYLDQIRISLEKEHSTLESCLIMCTRDGGSIEPIRLIKQVPAPLPVPYETWWPELEIEYFQQATKVGEGGRIESDDSGEDIPFTDSDLSHDAFIPLEELQSIVGLLRSRRNVILQGPPGVGKSFIAKRIAYAVMGTKSPSRVLSLQFHPNYSYEEFVEGYRPLKGEVGFGIELGSLPDFVETVVRKYGKDEPCVLILDEINRANLSTIFGEILSLIEADKRDARHAVQLLYSREPFVLPENLFVLGLMNTADRSIALVDYALRRRFAFVDLPPQFNDEFKNFLLRHGIPTSVIDQLFVAIQEINAHIRATTISLGRGFEIGHSYFCGCPEISTLAEANREEEAREWLDSVIRHDIAPLIREYWFDDRDTRAEMIRILYGRDLTEIEIRDLID